MDILISNTSGMPIYQQIVEQIRRLILIGELGPGDALPSMRLLAKELRISVITTKRAYEELEKEGLLQNIAGKGCYVTAQSPQMLAETRIHMAQEHLEKAVDVARLGGIPVGTLHELLDLLYQEGKTDE